MSVNGGGWLELPVCPAGRHGPACPAWCFGRAIHYTDRAPVWWKSYLDEGADPAYRALTLRQLGLLHELRRAYLLARGGLQLTGGEPLADRSLTARALLTITRTVGRRVRRADVEALIQAGFVTISASRPLAGRYQPASVEKRREEPPKPPKDREANTPGWQGSHPGCGGICGPFPTEARLRSHLAIVHGLEGHDADEWMPAGRGAAA